MGDTRDRLVMNDFLGQIESEKGPIECLGHTFPSDDARREHFLKLLAETLKDPEFRNQEGFMRPTGRSSRRPISDPPTTPHARIPGPGISSCATATL